MNFIKQNKKNAIVVLVLAIVLTMFIKTSIDSKKAQKNILLNPSNIDTNKLSINKKDTFFDIYDEKVDGYEELEEIYDNGFETCFVEYNEIKDILPKKIKEDYLKENNKLVKINDKNFISIFEIKNILGNKKFDELNIGMLQKYDDENNNIEYVNLLIKENNDSDNIELIKYFQD